MENGDVFLEKLKCRMVSHGHAGSGETREAGAKEASVRIADHIILGLSFINGLEFDRKS
jgi:hypothetical protein